MLAKQVGRGWLQRNLIVWRVHGRRKRLCCPILFGHVDKREHAWDAVNDRRVWSDGEAADAVNVVPTGQAAINCFYMTCVIYHN
jgi:hypothetical protein